MRAKTRDQLVGMGFNEMQIQGVARLYIEFKMEGIGLTYKQAGELYRVYENDIDRTISDFRTLVEGRKIDKKPYPKTQNIVDILTSKQAEDILDATKTGIEEALPILPDQQPDKEPPKTRHWYEAAQKDPNS